MKAHELQLTPAKDRKRVGRGIGSGYGKTAGRGTKGQKARTGGNIRPGFEGGQNPLAKRLPKKRGFTSLNPTSYQIVKLGQLAGYKAGSVIDADTLVASGTIKSAYAPVKILTNGELTTALKIKLQAASKTAQAAIEAAGGSFEAVSVTRKPVAGTKDKQA